MIKEVGISLLLSALKPVGPASVSGIDSSNFAPISASPVPIALPRSSIIRKLHPVQFCGEYVPLHQAAVTRRWVAMLLQQSAHWDYLFRLRKRAAQFFPIIEPIMVKYRIPRDFRFLPLAESELGSRSVSCKGAAGYWQLMPQTAREMGLIVKPGHDERNDLRKATRAACRYLQSLYRELGSWTLVAAAYNSGITHVQQKMEQQGHRSYYALRLHRETRLYLYRVLAHKELLTRPRIYRELLKPNVLACLTVPLVREKGHGLDFKSTTDDNGGPDLDPNPTWGPRNRNLLNEVLAQVEGERIDIDYSQDTTTMRSSPVQSQTMVAMGLMALRVLRFRRSRLHQVYLAAKRKIWPLFGWDWI